MTALATRPTRCNTATPVWTIGAPRLLAGLRTPAAPGAERLDAGEHLSTHGPLPGSDLEKILALLDASAGAGVGRGSTDRGSAAGRLASQLRSSAGHRRREVVVNGIDTEPGSLGGRVLLRRSTHLVLDGADAVATAIGARRVTVAVPDASTAAAVRVATAERCDLRHLRVREQPGGSAAGAARAAIRTGRGSAGRRGSAALRGGVALPPGWRTPPSAEGVVVGSVETFAQLAILLRLGPGRFAETGTPDEPGTTLLTVGGAVARPGVVEIPIGTPLRIVLSAAGSADPQAVVSGGPLGSWVAPVGDIRLSRAGLAAAGGAWGNGVLHVLDHATCGLGELVRVVNRLTGEPACCETCRLAIPALAADVATLASGQGTALAAAFERARALAGCGTCPRAAGVSRFVTSGLHVLHDENDRHAARGSCGRPVLGELALRPSR